MLFRQGRTEFLDFCIDAGDMEAFRRLSADTNPLHQDDGFAKRRGFAGAVVYGGLIVAQLSRLLGTTLPGFGCVWRSLSLNFKNPLYVGERARLSATVFHANEALGLVELTVLVESAGRRIAEGKAAALLADEREHA